MQYTREAAAKGAVVSVGFLVATATLTGLLPTPVFDRYVPRSGTDVLLLVVTALLLGVYTTQRCTRVDCSGDLPAVLGGLGGSFAVSCPYCIPVITGALGTSAIAAYLVPVRPVVGLASLGVLAGMITVRQRRLVTEGPAVADVELRCPTCGALLKNAPDTPDPEFTAGRMHIDITCPACDDPLTVFVEAAPGETLNIRKRVTRRRDGDRDDQHSRPSAFSLAPTDSPDERN